MDIYIERISYTLPEKILTNQELKTEFPDLDIEKLMAVTGVTERHVTQSEETGLDLGYQAALQILPDEASREKIGAILFCTQYPDFIKPANACILHGLLGFKSNVMALDIHVGCSGYVYCLELAKGLLSLGTYEQILLVTGDTMTKYLHPKDISSRYLMGDGATASIVSRQPGGLAIKDIDCHTFGKGHEKIMIKVGGCRYPKTEENVKEFTDRAGNVKTDAHFNMDGFAVLGFTTQKVAAQIKAYVKNQGLSMDEIDQFIFHQASRKLLDGLARALRVENAKVYSNLAGMGNTGANSIVIALKDAVDEKVIQPGDKVLLSAFGVGLSWATTLLEA